MKPITHGSYNVRKCKCNNIKETLYLSSMCVCLCGSVGALRCQLSELENIDRRRLTDIDRPTPQTRVHSI